ncbi:MAG: archaetidylserine decarboxylase [Immundisolibacterales bacterium]|nr:archaetidylserine decarboxylase [Immundisolibacterales bacterium]
MSPHFSVTLQYLYPRRLLSRIVLYATRIRISPWQQWLIRTVVRRYAVDLSDAEESDPRAWPTFNAFFTRALRPEARPLPVDPDAVAAPSDGTLQDAGELSGATLVQAKSLTYTLEALLGGDRETADSLTGAAAATIYLAPRDYHRVHVPIDATLTGLVHVPGDRFSVNPATAERIRHLFARNERVIFHFRDADGRPFVLVMVGALLVGSVETPWTGPVAELRRPGPERRWEFDGIDLARGAEIGRFNMGSTVIVLFPRGTVRWDPDFRSGATVRCREAIGRRVTG